MHTLFPDYIALILIILGLIMAARKLHVAYPILLVIGGLLLSFTAEFSNITIDPEYIFFIFLPPLLYEAAWQTSWKEFWKWRRVITSFAFPIVIITACVVAVTSSALIPGFTLALGFLLGGIVSPPDAISATTIMRQQKVPKSLVSIIEGESLLNDASSLVVFRFALAAVITGQFHWQQATLDFFLVIILGSLIGLSIGLIFFAIHRWLPTTSSMDIVLTLVTPYCMYYAAEHFHYSGVLAVVSGGLLLSNKRHTMLSYRSRIEAVNVWNSLVFVMNGLIFMLIGLQLPTIANQLGETSLKDAIIYGLAISLVLILARFACTFGAAAFTRFASRFITVADPNPEWKAPVIFGWAGMRGVVSLAAALSIPVYIATGDAFPYRNLILFITFIVILVTLVIQGLTLPWLIRKLNPTDRFEVIPIWQQEIVIQKRIARASLGFLNENYEGKIYNAYLDNIRDKLQLDLDSYRQELSEAAINNENEQRLFYTIYLKVLDEQRKLLHSLNNSSEFDEDMIRKYFALVDIEELKIRERIKEVNNQL